MSVEYLSKAFALQGVSSTQKLVLLALADRADHEGQCWPSYDDIRKRTCLTRNAISGAIKALEESGVLERQRRFSSSTVYRITVSSTEINTTSSTEIHTTISTESRTLTVNESSIEPSVSFDEFWKEYPNKRGRAVAEAKWSKLSDAVRNKIIKDVKLRKKYDDQWVKDSGRYIPHGSTYINRRLWEDDFSAPGSTSSINYKDFM